MSMQVKSVKLPGTKYVFGVFKRYLAIVKAISEYRNDTEGGNGGVNVAVKSGKISSPTENRAMKDIAPVPLITTRDGFIVRKPEKWLDVIHKTVKAHSNSDGENVIRMWLAGDDVSEVMAKSGMSKAAYYAFRKDVVNYAICLAVQENLIGVGRE
jgi:hypothetical protein